MLLITLIFPRFLGRITQKYKLRNASRSYLYGEIMDALLRGCGGIGHAGGPHRFRHKSGFFMQREWVLEGPKGGPRQSEREIGRAMEERPGCAMGRRAGVQGGEEGGGGGSHWIEIDGEFGNRIWRWEGFDPKIKEDVEEEERMFTEASGSTSSCSGTLGRVSAPDRDYLFIARHRLCHAGDVGES